MQLLLQMQQISVQRRHTVNKLRMLVGHRTLGILDLQRYHHRDLSKDLGFQTFRKPLFGRIGTDLFISLRSFQSFSRSAIVDGNNQRFRALSLEMLVDGM